MSMQLAPATHVLLVMIFPAQYLRTFINAFGVKAANSVLGAKAP